MIVIIWVMKIFLVQFFCVSFHLFLISFAFVRSIPFLSFIEPIFARNCSLGIFNFLDEISSLSHSVVFLYFFALIIVECSMWSTGEGNDKPLQYSCLENPMNSMKRQNYRILKEELPRLVSAQYATGDSGEITPERMKGWSQSKTILSCGCDW